MNLFVLVAGHPLSSGSSQGGLLIRQSGKARPALVWSVWSSFVVPHRTQVDLRAGGAHPTGRPALFSSSQNATVALLSDEKHETTLKHTRERESQKKHKVGAASVSLIAPALRKPGPSSCALLHEPPLFLFRFSTLSTWSIICARAGLNESQSFDNRGRLVFTDKVKDTACHCHLQRPQTSFTLSQKADLPLTLESSTTAPRTKQKQADASCTLHAKPRPLYPNVPATYSVHLHLIPPLIHRRHLRTTSNVPVTASCYCPWVSPLLFFEPIASIQSEIPLFLRFVQCHLCSFDRPLSRPPVPPSLFIFLNLASA